MLRTLFSATILVGALAGTAMAQAPDAGCALPSEPKGIPAAVDAAITGPADKDRACMKALFIPEARMMFVSLGADGARLLQEQKRNPPGCKNHFSRQSRRGELFRTDRARSAVVTLRRFGNYDSTRTKP